jgi:hypothetical protein
MAGYYDPNVGWIEFTGEQAASIPKAQQLPWMPTQDVFIADPFGGGGNYFQGVTPTGVNADPNNYENWQNLWLNKSATPDWSLGLARYGENMLGKNYESQLKSLAQDLYGVQADNLAWQKAILGMNDYFGQNGMQVSPNSSDAYLTQETLRALGQQNNLDMTKFNNLVGGQDWQNYFNQSAQQAGQQQTQYNAASANPMPWPVALIAAATGGLMGYGALTGAGVLGGAGSGAGSLGGIVSPEVANFGVVNGVNAANLADLSGVAGGLGAGTGSFTVPNSGLGSSGFGVMNASGASDMSSFFPDVLDMADWWAQDSSAALDAGSWGDWIGQTAPNAIDYTGTMAGDQGIYGSLMDAYNAIPSGARSTLSNLTNAPSSLVKGLTSLFGSDPYTINSVLGGLSGLTGSNGLGSLLGNNSVLGTAASLAPIWYGYSKGNDIIGNGFDTSRQQDLYNQFNPKAGTLEYDLNTGLGREALNAGLQRRNVTGSSFANFDNASYNTLRELGRQDLLNKNVGVAGSLANSITSTDIAKAQMQMDLLGRALGAAGWALGGRSLLG